MWGLNHRTVPAVLCVCCFSLLLTSACGTGAATSATTQSPSVTYSASPIVHSIAASSAAPVSSTYFGMHIHNLANPALNAAQQTPFPAFPVSTLRLWDNTTWRTIETGPGVFDWTRLDGTIQKAAANGTADFVFTFGYVPQWASSNPTDPCSGTYSGSCDAPANLSDLDDFTNNLVQRYCGVIKFYETWNEPSDPGFWNGTNLQLLTITEHIYAAVKNPANCGCTNGRCAPGNGENPNKVLFPPVANPASTSAKQWLHNFLSSAANPYPYADIATFHGYGYTATPEDIGNGVQSMRSELSQFGMGAAELWDTEASWGNTTAQTQDQQAAWLIRYHILQALSGVSRFMWYAYDDCNWGPLWGSATCTSSSTALEGTHEAAIAYATVQQWLNGATLQSCDQHADETWICKLSRPGKYSALAAWNSNGISAVLSASDVPGLVQYRDWKNQKTSIATNITIGSMPILLENQDGF